MPFITVDLHAGTTTADQRRAISDALHEAMKEVLGIPDDDRFHAFYEHEEGFFFHEDVMFGLPRDKGLMCITLSFNNRGAEEKQRLYAAIERHLHDLAGVTRDRFALRVLETARENWWAAGRVVNPETGYDERMSAPTA
jgi:phenylpyruvate tautomerase PptA (4-oxalocrotonate tautomerase family)